MSNLTKEHTNAGKVSDIFEGHSERAFAYVNKQFHEIITLIKHLQMNRRFVANLLILISITW